MFDNIVTFMEIAEKNLIKATQCLNPDYDNFTDEEKKIIKLKTENLFEITKIFSDRLD